MYYSHAKPVPGLDPYLEARWGTFHGLLAGAITSGLNHLLPPDLEARLEEQARVKSVVGDDLRPNRPDVAVLEVGAMTGGGGTATAVLAEPATLADPAEIRVQSLQVPVVRHRVVLVDLAAGDRVITVVEVLSPSDKRTGRGNRECRRDL